MVIKNKIEFPDSKIIINVAILTWIVLIWEIIDFSVYLICYWAQYLKYASYIYIQTSSLRHKLA